MTRRRDGRLSDLIEDIRGRVGGLGYELVDLRRGNAGRRARLQLRIDRPDARPGAGITVEECAQVSRALEAWLDAEQVLGPNYVLEVSSPGIERPVRWREHWQRFRGRDVHVRLAGRPRARATIVRVLADEDAVELRFVEGGELVTVPLAEVRDASLVVDWDAIGQREP